MHTFYIDTNGKPCYAHFAKAEKDCANVKCLNSFYHISLTYYGKEQKWVVKSKPQPEMDRPEVFTMLCSI